MENEGWRCPRCGKVWSPNITFCNCKDPQMGEGINDGQGQAFDKLTRKGDDIRKGHV